jgi:hypothetical protein
METSISSLALRPRKVVEWIRHLLATCLISGAALILAGGAQAQSIGGAIVGRVKDSSGASVEAALVQIAGSGTGGARVVSTDQAGRFAALEIPPGKHACSPRRRCFQRAHF